MSQHERILTRPVITLLLVMVAFGLDFMMFLSVGPRLVDIAGAPMLAGYLTSTMLASTVAIRFAYPWIEARISPKPLGVIAIGLMAVGALFFFVINASPILMFVAALFRGVGFGIITVLAQGLIMAVAAPETRGRVAGFIGVFGTVSSIISPLLGLTLIDAGFNWAPGAMAAAFGLAAALLLLTLQLPKSIERAPHEKTDSILKAMRNPKVAANVITLLLCSVAWAGVASFMPLVLNAETSLPAQYFLLIYFIVVALTRWICGQVQDKWGIRDVTLAPAVIGIALSMFIIGYVHGTIAGVIAAIIVGVSMGWIQNMTFYSVLSTPGHSSFVLSAAWVNGIDAGGLVGTLVLSTIAASMGLAVVPAAIAILALLALIPVSVLIVLERRSGLTTDDSRVVEVSA